MSRDRIGQTTFRVDPTKVVPLSETNCRDSASPLTAPDAVSEAIAGHVLEFFDFEVRAGRMPADTLLPLQAGIGNVRQRGARRARSGAVSRLTCYSEVIQDGMLKLIKDGTVAHASSTALGAHREGIEELTANIDFYRHHITLRPQEISNHPEVCGRLGIIAMNGMLEADIYAT